ncbi:tail fiber domain-containing protein [Flavobacterium sp. JLP]|uniref:tail fiber domain-containing protein n=1 Tax=unclassified Flavobacterium TaxID=196869 RepID=UPI00188CFF43|nr:MULTISPECIES: tail fiber domain-containing protein [unclassified Flavobacterium]MBF4494766.1 tail fiber domain-containing protein [Flavobacterium sp. MR2016-29]MBF4507856.1 tail fiber domain-containing protein [Flavobacterium sp. JLP]
MLLLIQSGFIMAQTSETVVTPNGKKVTFYPGAPGAANNGLTITNGTVQFGGSLIQPSVLTTTASNTLAITGLQTGALTDQILSMDANGVLRKIVNNSWNINGNTGTTAGTNFIGTTDDQDLVFKRNGFESGRIGLLNTSFGYNSSVANTGKYAVAFGINALENNTGSYCVGIGYNVLKVNTASNNIAVGYNVLMSNTTGNSNVGFGTHTLASNTIGSENVGIGLQALQVNNTGSDNVAIGLSALNANLSGNQNIAIGFALAKSETTSFNIALGAAALGGLTRGNNNIAIGMEAGGYYGVENSIQILTSLKNSVVIGNKAYPQKDNDENEIVIGHDSRGRGSNTVQIGNDQMTSIGGQVAWSNPSDVRLKKDIVKSNFGLNFITKLRPVTYKMKAGVTGLQSGFIAQEVESAANDIGYEFSGVVKPQSDKDFYSLRYSEFVVPLVKAVQEQQTQIEKQQTQIEQQQKDIQELKELVQKLLNK